MSTKILMVCLGNICRSPLAEGILKSKVDTTKITVDSAGTSGFHHGSMPDSRSIAIAADFGLDITDQRSRPFKMADFDIFDIIYVMDRSNYKNIMNLARTEAHQQKVKLILNETNRNFKEVPDPYYDDNGFLEVYQMLDEACDVIASKL